LMCYHKFRTDTGLMGDAWTCIKCGYSKYPEWISFKWLWKLLGRTVDD